MAKQNTSRRQAWKEDRVMAWQNTSGDDKPLMQFIAEKMPTAKRADIKVWLKYGHAMINGVVTHAFDAPIPPGGWLELNLTRPFPVFKNSRMNLIYEDDDILVVNKGYGLLSVGTGASRNEETAYNILKEYVKAWHPSNKVFVVHRLDRHTSGLMVFAKNMEAQHALQHNWNNMVLERKYVAVVEGKIEEDSGVIRSNLDETSEFEVYSTPNRGEGKTATTRYKVLDRGANYTLVEFSLDTGRKNQIRVHAKDLGHPIAGDRKYGAKKSPLHRLALHARTLRFAHPVTRRDMHFELPIPSKFVGVVRHG